MLHVHCGDSSAGSLRQGGVPGEVIVWADVLTDGPVRDVDEETFRRDRARFLAEHTGGGLTFEGCLERLERQDAQLARFSEHDETVFWFDGCLYDQTILMRQLAWAAARERGSTRVSLLCIGEFPEIENYAGLGEMTPDQLADRLPERVEITPAMFDRAAAAWNAYRSPDPRAIEGISKDGVPGLGDLDHALRRHLQQFPSARNGLNRVENEVLAAVASGATKPGPIFRTTSSREERPFFGDTYLWWTINRLASAQAPAFHLDGPGPLPQWDPPRDLSPWTVVATDFGRELVAGGADWVEANRIDRWLGGAHLRGKTAAWRWDEENGRLVGSA